MKTNYLRILCAIVLGLFALGAINPLRAAGGADAKAPKEITAEEAAKKYPPDKTGKYLEATPTGTSSVGGFFKSPYSSNTYDCRKVKKGALLLDSSVNKVFLRP